MGIMVRERALQQAGLMEVGRRGGGFGVELEPEPQLPSGWEKCLDMKSGLIYYKDWNTGTQTYRDPRQGKQPNSTVATAQRIGLLSISLLSHETTSAVETKSTPINDNVVDEDEEAATPAKKFKRKAKQAPQVAPQETGFPWSLTMGTTTTATTPCNPSHHNSRLITTDEDSTDREYGPETSLSMENNNNNNDDDDEEVRQLQGDHDQSLDLSLQLPGMSRSRSKSQQICQSVCTVEKVRSALERSQWLTQTPNASSGGMAKKRPSGSSSSGQLTNTLSTSLSLLSPRPSSSRESNSPGPQSPKPSQAATESSPSTSQCSDSECFTSPSAMSYQGDDDEVQQPRVMCREQLPLIPASWATKAGSETTEGGEEGEVMVAVGCKSCLMYVMLSKLNPSCPKCGNTDVLLELPPPLLKPKKQRTHQLDTGSATWSWSTA